MDPRRAAGSVLGAILGLLVVVIGTVVVILVYGFFVGTYNSAGGLNTSLSSGWSGASNNTNIATTINNFFGTTNATLPLLSLVPLIIIASVVIYLIVSGFGGRGG